MKSVSPIYVQMQRQMTILGLPPRLFALPITGAVLGASPSILLLSPSILLPGLLLGFFLSWLWLLRRFRSDLHFDRRLFVAPRFWRRKAERRLIAGRRP